MSGAYYNEIDEYAAQWLRNLISAGHIAPGDVDTRSIDDVKPDDLRGYTQCHFFAGIGVWSHALRLAGWPDDRPVWTGSCPCQPFSAAGAGVGFADERHLWPAWFHLISQCRPDVVFGEQVEAAIRHGWLDLVQTDMEGLDYAFGAAGIPAAGVRAPHIRARLWFVADADQEQRGRGTVGEGLRPNGPTFGREQSDSIAQPDSAIERLANAYDTGLEGLGRGHQTEGGRYGAVRPTAEASEFGGVADSYLQRQQPAGDSKGFGEFGRFGEASGVDHAGRAGTSASFWGDADWLFCRDGKWRPVEPGTFPLAHGASARVGRLRAYGNAIVAQVAAEWIGAYLACKP